MSAVDRKLSLRSWLEVKSNKKNLCAVLGILGVFHKNKRKPEGFGIKRDNKIQKLSHSKNQKALLEYRHCFKQQLTKHRIIEILKRSKLHAA